MENNLLPFQISPQGSDLKISSEESGDTYLELVGWYMEGIRSEWVKISFERCLGSKMSCIPIGGTSTIGVIENSPWLAELNSYQKKYYPDFMDNFKDVKHYYFRSHDETAEFLAEGLSWEKIGNINN